MVEQAPVRASDVFVDVGSGLGRATALVHLLTGAAAIGLEIQPRLVHTARDLATRLLVPRVSFVEGDAAQLAGVIAVGSVFFLYCPFSGDRLAKVLVQLERIAQTRTIRVCCVDLPLPPCSWLTLDPQISGDLAIHRSTLHDAHLNGAACAAPRA
jgi:SAM-dependent methyltransferase